MCSTRPGAENWERYEMFLAEERRALPARVYRQEYECSFEETEDQLFSEEEIETAMSDEVTPLFAGSEDADDRFP